MMASQRHEEPPTLPYSGFAMSNFDHRVPPGMEAALKAGGSGIHPAWNHWGYVWFSEGEFHEAVYQHHALVAICDAASLDDLMREVNSDWGDE